WRSQPHLLLALRQALAERRAREHQLRILLDRLGLWRQVDLIVRQPPQHRRNGGIDQRELVGQKVRLHLEQIGALQNRIAQDLLLDKIPLQRPVRCKRPVPPAPRRDGQCTSFQYSRFTSQASQVNTSRNSTTHTPSARRAVCVGSLT